MNTTGTYIVGYDAQGMLVSRPNGPWEAITDQGVDHARTSLIRHGAENLYHVEAHSPEAAVLAADERHTSYLINGSGL